MKIYRATRSNRKTQGFGQNLPCAKTNPNGQLAIPTSIKSARNGTCQRGYKLFYPLIGMKGHNGEDWATWRGEPIYFNVDALDQEGKQMKWWSRSEIDRAGGVGVDIFSAERVHLKLLPIQVGRLAQREWEKHQGWVYLKFRYWHLQDVFLENPQRSDVEVFHPEPNVVLGQVFARCDSTGASSGDHVHWSMKIVAKNSMTLDNDNGYTGAVDFTEWFENKFIVDILDHLQEQILTASEQIRKLILRVQILLGLR